jgi:hypothetical protein
MQLVGHIPSVVYPQIWKAKATPKCRLHSWILVHNKCLTADNLEKRGWPHNPICRLCFISPETAPHISASCPYSRTIWYLLLARFHLPQTLAPVATTDRLDDWWLHCSSLVPKLIRTRWRSLALLTWWMLWKERNNRIFNNVACTEASLIDKIAAELDQWCAARVLGTSWPAGEWSIRSYRCMAKPLHSLAVCTVFFYVCVCVFSLFLPSLCKPLPTVLRRPLSRFRLN